MRWCTDVCEEGIANVVYKRRMMLGCAESSADRVRFRCSGARLASRLEVSSAKRLSIAKSMVKVRRQAWAERKNFVQMLAESAVSCFKAVRSVGQGTVIKKFCSGNAET
ncbi:hypothetical protein HBH47_157540 [Parastagonospora nodorum]|nr:hypothetical protein HBH47_157540 [Parastagonospora nodorum]